jgi:phosphomannomutase/phosphoglucomutase
MTSISPKIFKKYDIRGLASGDDAVVTRDAARLIGQAFGTYLQQVDGKHTVFVGRDNRHTSEALASAAMEGLANCGCEVTDIGLVSTPVVYWHAVQSGNSGGLMVTGSHLGPDQNGFKLSVGNRNLYGDQIVMLQTLIENGNLRAERGGVTHDTGASNRYVEDVAKRVQMARSLHVVVDAGNGTGGLFGPALIERWGHRVTRLFCEPDGNYPNHQPDPQKPENMAALGAKVKGVGADIGLAFDGDADRVGAVDERGIMITADRLLALLARDMLTRHPGQYVVADVLSSQVLFDEIDKAGGKPVMWISGHSLIKAKMHELGSLLGGEMSGHIFLGEDYFGYDDGYMAAGRILQLLAASGHPLSALDANIPTLFSTPEYRPHCPDEAKQTVIDGVKTALGNLGDVNDVDGVRIRFERGWGIIRASNTEPVLSLRFEGETEADALAYRDLFAEVVRRYPQVEGFVGAANEAEQ